MTPSPKLVGGVWVHGLCVDCNGRVQGRWDHDYCDLAKRLWPFVVGHELWVPKTPHQLPDVAVRPGAVARFVLAGAFALDSRLRELYPSIADDLINNADAVDLPDGLGLYLALTRGPQAVVSGAMNGFFFLSPKINDELPGFMTFAQVYFPPLAWQLADPAKSPLLGLQGWANVTDWLTRPDKMELMLRDVAPALPFVIYPRQNPAEANLWSELLHDESCFIVVSDNALPADWLRP